MIDSDVASARSRALQSSGQVAQKNEAPTTRENSVSTGPRIQISPQCPRVPYHGIADETLGVWSPLQRPVQTSPAQQQHVVYPGTPALTRERSYDGSEDGREEISCPVDTHVSFSQQHHLQNPKNLPPCSDSRASSPSLQPSTNTAWALLPMSAVSCSTTNKLIGDKTPRIHIQEPRASSNKSSAPDVPLQGSNSRKFEKEVRRTLLLKAYPALYVLLWIPGIMNRFMEATGMSPSSTRVVGALQSTSHFVGFANSLTFGLSATMRCRISSTAPRMRWMGRLGKV